MNIFGQTTPIVLFNQIIGTLFFLCFFYQMVFAVAGIFKKPPAFPKAKKQHAYAFFIAAHNEEAVIANLVKSIQAQDYPSELIDIFVVADACTDNTAQVARDAGAIVYERNDLARKGKSWVMDYGFDRILHEYPGKHDAFFVFDADNLLAPDYVSKMNDAFDQGYMALTSYRNSKNFGSSWVSSGYALAFLREARLLNGPREMFKTSCAVSGSGYLISARIIEGMHGWAFHFLTEDIQFSSFCAIHGVRIGYCEAEFFDEQPVKLRPSIKQRMRWTKGFYQILFTYTGPFLKAIFKKRGFAAYDLFMTVAPGNLITMLLLLVNATFLIVGGLSHGFLATDTEMQECWRSIFITFGYLYLTYFVMGAVTTATEYKNIHCPQKWRIFTNLFTYPLFMLTYLPLTVAALFLKVDWVPTPHDISVNLEEVLEGVK